MRMLQRWPYDASIWARRGEVATAAGRLRDAEEYYQEAVAIQPDDVGYWTGLATTAVAGDNKPLARDAYQKAMVLRPDDAALWLEAGRYFAEAGWASDARAAFERVLELEPDNTEALDRLAHWMVNNPMTAYPKPVFAARRDRPVTSTVGDWLLTFGIENPAGPTRSSTGVWAAEAQGAAWRLSRSATQGELVGHAYDGRRRSPAGRPGCLASFTPRPNPAEIIADVVEGRSSPTILNGHFLLLAQDRQTGEWHIWTNRYATLHAYVATNGPRVAIGSFMPAVAGAVGRDGLDWEGLTSFFGFGFFMGDRTHFQGVRILRPAAHYRFDGDGRALGKARYWHWQHMPDRARTYDETVDEFATLLAM